MNSLLFFYSNKVNIKKEQLNLLYKSSIMSQTLGIGATFICAFIFSDVIDNTALYIWLSLMSCLYAYRTILSLYFNREKLTESNINIWAYLFYFNTFISGIGWSFLAFGFDLSENPIHLIMLVIVYTGITASAHNTHTPIFISYPAFFLPPVLALMYGIITQLHVYGHYLFVMFLLYIVTMLSSSYSYHKKIISLLEAQFKNNKLKNELLQANEELSTLANSDGLTGIYNRRHFDFIIEKEWKFHFKHQLPLSLLLIDIDYFKQYNDTYGHEQGDQCLISIAKLLRYSMRDNRDMCSRYGGEEFVIILPETSPNGALTVATRIKDALDKLKIEHAKSKVSNHVTMSMGIVTTVPKQESYHSHLFHKADKALYQAKADGRNQIVVYPDL